MIKILEKTQDDTIALEAEGKIERKDYENILPLIEEKVKKYEHIKGYVEVKELDTMTIPALWEELKADVKYFNNFDKIAVVGDAKWKEALTKASDIVPGLETKYFEFNEKDRARAWLEA